MKQTLFLSVLQAVLSSTLLGVEYGYFYGSSTQPSNQVVVPAGKFLTISTGSTSGYRLEADDNLCIEAEGQIFKARKGTSHYSFSGKSFYGPCTIYYEFNNNNTGYLPFKISSVEVNQSPQIAIPAGQNLLNINDFVIQFSEDGISWSNVNAGIIYQSNSPKFYRLVLENPNTTIQQLNANFGFGSSNPTTTAYTHKIVNAKPSNKYELSHFLTLNEGEVFRPTSGFIIDQHYHIYFSNEHISTSIKAFEYYRPTTITHPDAAIKGPANLFYKVDAAPDDQEVADLLSYSITTQLEQAQLSGAVLTVPSGAGTYTLKIQVSDDLNNDWIDLGGTVPDTLSENMRFYRLVAVQN